MKGFWTFCFLLGLAFVLAAQTNSVSPMPEAAAAASKAPAEIPMEVKLTEIKSRSGQFFMKSNVFVYHGDVHIDDPRMKLTCELLTVEAPRLPAGKFNRATAETNVVIDWTDEKGPNHATSDKAVYTYVVTNATEARLETNATVVLTGNPVITNLQGTFQGDPIVWDRINQTITSPNFLKMTIQQGETNSPGLFDAPGTSKGEPAKPKAGEGPK